VLRIVNLEHERVTCLDTVDRVEDVFNIHISDSLEVTVFILSVIGHVKGLRVALFHQLSSAFVIVFSFLRDSLEIWRLVGALNSRSLNLDGFDVTLFSIVAFKLTIDISSLGQVLNNRRGLSSRVGNLNLGSGNEFQLLGLTSAILVTDFINWRDVVASTYSKSVGACTSVLLTIRSKGARGGAIISLNTLAIRRTRLLCVVTTTEITIVESLSGTVTGIGDVTELLTLLILEDVSTAATA
jgi:hypothetical protein